MQDGATALPLTVLLCLGLCRGQRNQVQTRTLPKPSIWADPGPIITRGSSVMIWCLGSWQAITYYLHKASDPQYQYEQNPSNFRDKISFVIKSMDVQHAGRYHCGYESWSGWSGWSDSLILVTTGIYDKPSLSAHPGPSVTSGNNVTLQCRSDHSADTFHLFKGVFVAPPKRFHWQKSTESHQANFTISHVNSTHEGTYRCYSAKSTSPYLLSQPSDSLELVVSASHPETKPTTGSSKNQQHTDGESEPKGGLPDYLKVLIGVLVAFILLLFLFLLLFFFIRYQRQGKHRTTVSESKDRSLPKSSSQATEDQEDNLYSAVVDKQPEKETELDSLQSPEDENHQYEEVNTRSRQRVAASLSSLPEKLQEVKDRQVEEDSQRNSQVAAPEDPQEVTYARLNHSTLRRETSTPPFSQTGGPTEEPSVYAALAIH